MLIPVSLPCIFRVSPLILELRADVESTTILEDEFRFFFEQKDVLLIPKRNTDRKNVIAEISIRKKIPEDAGFRTVSKPPTKDEPGHISAVGFEPTAEELEGDLQFLESLLSIWRDESIMGFCETCFHSGDGS